MPTLKPHRCAQRTCTSIITASMFTAGDISTAICETCYRRHHGSDRTYTKVYKHSILSEIMTPAAAERVCRCPEVARYDTAGRPAALYPHDQVAGHLGSARSSGVKCGLLRLGAVEVRAKYDGLMAVSGGTGGTFSVIMGRVSGDEKKALFHRKRVASVSSRQGGGGGQLVLEGGVVPKASSVVTDPEQDANVPKFFRDIADKKAFSDIHMALRVGPLVIENGVAK